MSEEGTRLSLAIHPDSHCDAVIGIDVEVVRSRNGDLALEFMITGAMDDVAMPNDQPGRGTDLWRHTCLEAFVRPPSGDAYYEINVAPSRQWAVYRFDAYRGGMAQVALDPVGIDCQRGNTGLDLHFVFPLGGKPCLLADVAWRVAISAVIEETNGRISYWALKHPAGKPDFHHPDCFALELPPPSQT